MKVICIFDFIVSPLAEQIEDSVKYGKTYTVIGERQGYSIFGKRWVDAYEFKEVKGLYEKGIFIPMEENTFDNALRRMMQVPKYKYKKKKNIWRLKRKIHNFGLQVKIFNVSVVRIFFCLISSLRSIFI